MEEGSSDLSAVLTWSTASATRSCGIEKCWQPAPRETLWLLAGYWGRGNPVSLVICV